MMDPKALLSLRAQKEATPKLNTLLWKVYSDQWDPQTNPGGYVSIGVAENKLLHGDLEQHITKHMNVKDCALTYGDGPKGSNRLRRALADFLNRRFQPHVRLEPSHVMVTNGVTTGIEHLSWACGNQGDAFLLGQPFYGAFPGDVTLRPGVGLIMVKFGSIDPLSIEAVRKYEEAILDAQKRGVAVRGLILCNPHNPLGRCYPREALLEYLGLCEKYQMHFISDEIYGLSVWENVEDSSPPQAPFYSILSVDLVGVINPALVHVLWGTSKDFGANGLRVACLISQANPALHGALTSVALMSSVSSLADYAVANLLEDSAYTDIYIAKNCQLLSQHYSQVVAFLKQHDVPYAPGSNAGFFVWLNLGQPYCKRHPSRDIGRDLTEEVMDALLEQKLYLASGIMFGSEEPGWFRITISTPSEYLQEALKRMVKAIEVGYPERS
jgi:aspartate/methionine/tyrosine aminotransferase